MSMMGVGTYTYIISSSNGRAVEPSGLAATTQFLMFVLSALSFLTRPGWNRSTAFFIRVFGTNPARVNPGGTPKSKREPRVSIPPVDLDLMVRFLNFVRFKPMAMAFGWSPQFLYPASLANPSPGPVEFALRRVGIAESDLRKALTYFGIPSSLALSVTLIERLISYVSSTVVGFITLVTSGGVELWKALRSR